MDSRESQQRNLHTLHTDIHHEYNFFPGQRENEKVQLCVRQHWIVELKIFFGFLIAGVLLPSTIFGLAELIDLAAEKLMWLKFTFSIYLLFVWLLTFIEFLKKELTALILTNERIVDIIQHSLFDHQVSETSLTKIQDVIGQTRGVIGTFFDVGSVEIQTAGRDIIFSSQNVKSPHLTARKILEIQKLSQTRRRESDNGLGGQIKKRATDEISDLDVLRLRGQNSTPHRKSTEEHL